MSTSINQVSITESNNIVSITEAPYKISVTQNNPTIVISTPYVKEGTGMQHVFKTITDGSNSAVADSTADTFTITGTSPVSTTVNASADSVTIAVANATTSAHGLMSSSDKTKLDALSTDDSIASSFTVTGTIPSTPTAHINNITTTNLRVGDLITGPGLPALDHAGNPTAIGGILSAGSNNNGQIYTTANADSSQSNGTYTIYSDGPVSKTISKRIVDLDTDLSSVSSSDDTIASAKATKAYVDTNIVQGSINWTVDQGSTNIHPGNYINTTYSVQDGELSQNNFTNAFKTKLDNISSNQILDWTSDQGSSNIHVNNLPAIALTNVQEASSESAQLALTTQEGDVVVRTDENKSYVRNSGTAGSMSDFTLLRTPTDAVLSVNGSTGAVTLNHDTLPGFVANEHIDWTTDQGSTNIHAGNIPTTGVTEDDIIALSLALG